jgi:hypothetical protein
MTSTADSMSELSEPLKSPYSPIGIITETYFEHFMHFQCLFPQFEAKLNAGALLLQIRLESCGLHLKCTLINTI